MARFAEFLSCASLHSYPKGRNHHLDNSVQPTQKKHRDRGLLLQEGRLLCVVLLFLMISSERWVTQGCANHFLALNTALGMRSHLPKAAGSGAMLNAELLGGLNHSQPVNDALVPLLGDRQQLRKSFLMRPRGLPARSVGAQRAPL